MEYDASDILGHTDLPVARGKNSGPSSSFSMGQSVFIGVVSLVVYMVAKRLWKRALLWQEKSYKLATRRRHGIPDSDLRPFNVAYSAAMTKAREEESRSQVKSNPLLRPQGRLLDRHDTQPEQTLRYCSVPEQRLHTHPETATLPGPIAPNTNAPSSNSNPEHIFMNHYVPRQPTHSAQASSSTAPPRPLIRQPAYSHLEDLTSDEGKKRSLDEQEDDEHEIKKSRVDGDEVINGDEDAEFYDLGDTAPKRGSKRGFGEHEDGSEEVTETKKFRGKRARKVSQENARQSHAKDDNMDIDDEELDEVTELRPRSRGKKRDRAEAGSTFGGDDEDSTAELEPEDDIKARRRRRKRRTVARRKSEASHARGKKRDRNTDSDQSDQESDESLQVKASRKKRGKRGSDRYEDNHASRSDVSMDESITSVRGKVRVIGEEWESNGIKYKVGLNGQRLRQALVKQARQKFVMPIDSQHPDRNANVQICIECWLTEEEYQQKKAERMLAWQDGTPPRQEGPLKNLSLHVTDPQLSQSVAGKNLLWGSSTASTPTASPPPSHSPTETPPEFAKPRSYRDGYRHSIATTVGLPISPFRNSQIPVKRIASTPRASLSGLSGPPGLSDSTNGNPRTATKAFSKWEKQELEAQAIMKMREANRKKELEREAKLKEEREKAERAAAERARLEKERLDRERAEKERAEKERAEKERVEKERVEKEKAEAERKAKEAAQVPKITVTAPSSDNVTAPATSTGVPNFFSMPPTGSTTATPVANTAPFFSNASAPVSAPTNFAQAEPTKSQSPFNLTAPSGNSSGNATASSRSSAFSFPSSTTGPKTEGSAQSSFGPLSSTQAPATALEPSKPTPAQPSQQPFSFPKPNGLNSMNINHPQTVHTPSAQPHPSASSSTNAPPKFSFNIPNKPATPNPPPAASTTAFPSSSSLTGALGSDQQKTTSNTSNPPMFNFKVPTTPASASTNTTSTTPAATTSPSKFVFGPSGFSSSPSSSGPQEQNKEPSKSSFGNTNNASAFPSNSGTGSSLFGENTSSFKPTVPNNAFGTHTFTSQGQKSVFGGGTNSTAFSTNTPFGVSSSAGQGQKSVFGEGRTNTTTAFSNNTGTSPSPFGIQQTQTSNVFSSGVFGNSTEPPKSVFGNGSTATTSAPSGDTGLPAATTTPSGTPGSGTGGTGAFGFGFGTTPQSSPFGSSGTSSTTPSVFGAQQQK